MNDDREAAGPRPTAPPRPGQGPGGVERRRHPRVDVEAKVQIRHAANSHVAEIRDISRSGARLALPADSKALWARPDQVVQLRLHVVDLDSELGLNGRIVWARRRPESSSLEVGLEFEGLDVPTQRKLEWVVDKAFAGQRVILPPPLPPE